MLPVLLWMGLQPAPESGRIGIAWDSQARPSPELRQRLRAAVVQSTGTPRQDVVDDVVVRARRLIAREVPRERMQAQADRSSRLDEAGLAFRSGSFDRAEGLTNEVVQALRSEPGLPGTARLEWRARILRARIAWNKGDLERADTELGRAVALDPDAALSTRDVPPDLAARHTAVRERIVGERSTWRVPRVVLDVDEPYSIVIDDVPGMRPLPPGEHHVQLWRDGRAPVSALHSFEEPWHVPGEPELIPKRLPEARSVAERICARTEVEVIVLARALDRRLGIQGYRCGVGFARPWFGATTRLEEGVAEAVSVATDDANFVAARPALIDHHRWPSDSLEAPKPSVDARDRTSPRPWYRRAWIWALVGSVVIGGVVTGAVLGTRDDATRVRVETPGFTRPE